MAVPCQQAPHLCFCTPRAGRLTAGRACAAPHRPCPLRALLEPPTLLAGTRARFFLRGLGLAQAQGVKEGCMLKTVLSKPHGYGCSCRFFSASSPSLLPLRLVPCPVLHCSFSALFATVALGKMKCPGAVWLGLPSPETCAGGGALPSFLWLPFAFPISHGNLPWHCLAGAVPWHNEQPGSAVSL